MIFKKTLIVGISIFMLVSCRITQEQAAGKYVDKTYNDSLKLNKDGSYVYIETLKSGALGRTDGQWILDHKQVIFTKDKPAFIGHRIEVDRAQKAKEGSLKFLLGNTDKSLNIQKINVSMDDKIRSGADLILTNNTAKLPDTFDFIVINTDHFANILIKDTLQSNYQYTVRIFPIERLYELDHIPFVVSGKKLKSRQKTMYDNRVIKFKKTRK